MDGNSTGSRNAWAWFFADSSQLMNANAAFGFLQYFVIARKDPPRLPAPPGAAVTRQSPFVFGAAFFGPSCAHQTAALYATSLPLVTTAFASVVPDCAFADSPSLTTRIDEIERVADVVLVADVLAVFGHVALGLLGQCVAEDTGDVVRDGRAGHGRP